MPVRIDEMQSTVEPTPEAGGGGGGASSSDTNAESVRELLARLQRDANRTSAWDFDD